MSIFLAEPPKEIIKVICLSVRLSVSGCYKHTQWTSRHLQTPITVSDFVVFQTEKNGRFGQRSSLAAPSAGGAS